MSQITKPVILDETGQAIITKLGEIKDAISESVPNIRPVRIMVVTPPTKSAYSIGEEFDSDGIAISAVYNDNTILDITPQCVLSPADGEKVLTDTLSVSWTWNYTRTFETTQALVLSVPSWSSGTATQIEDALDAHYAGNIDLRDYWEVGSERTISLSAMEATGVGESHAAQDNVLILSAIGGKYLEDGETECLFQVDFKNELEEPGYMNSTATYTGGWRDCARRTWCNSVFRDAIPESLRSIFKKHINLSNDKENDNATLTTTDYFALRSEKEITGSATYSGYNTGSQIGIYESSNYRIKKYSYSSSYVSGTYWTRSASYYAGDKGFAAIDTSGNSGMAAANGNYYIAPFGVI